jgi:hypothetical protein
VISPSETSTEQAIQRFQSRAQTVNGGNGNGEHTTASNGNFERWVGTTAYQRLRDWADIFVDGVLKTYHP